MSSYFSVSVVDALVDASVVAARKVERMVDDKEAGDFSFYTEERHTRAGEVEHGKAGRTVARERRCTV